jgi:hypothetical protein
MSIELETLKVAIANAQKVTVGCGWDALSNWARRDTEALLEAAIAAANVLDTLNNRLEGVKAQVDAHAETRNLLATLVGEIQETLAAFIEVQKHYPYVESVTYDPDGRWCYRNTASDRMVFSDLVDTNILQAAADVVTLPSVYFKVEG